jgi:hypothetical protein
MATSALPGKTGKGVAIFIEISIQSQNIGLILQQTSITASAPSGPPG